MVFQVCSGSDYVFLCDSVGRSRKDRNLASRVVVYQMPDQQMWRSIPQTECEVGGKCPEEVQENATSKCDGSFMNVLW